jgi:phospholipid transport system substrate-binding protein
MSMFKRFGGMAVLGLVLSLVFALGATPTTAPTTAPATSPAADDPASAATARSMVEKLLSQVTTILRDPKLTKAQCSQKVREIAYGNIDFPTLARLTVAQNWRTLTAQQQSDFVEQFRTHLAVTYAHITDDYDNEDLLAVGDRQESNGDWTVMTTIVGKKTGDPKQDVTKVDYRLRKADNRWKVIDVTIEGVSLVANFRAQFQDIISNGGFDHLLQLLKDKNAADAK